MLGNDDCKIKQSISMIGIIGNDQQRLQLNVYTEFTKTVNFLTQNLESEDFLASD